MTMNGDVSRSDTSFLKNAVPMAILATCLVLGYLDLNGFIDLSDVGRQAGGYLSGSSEGYELEEADGDSIVELKDAVVGVPYRDNLRYYLLVDGREGFTCPCKYAADPYGISDGLSFSEDDGMLTGTPLSAGTWTFDVCIEDSNGYEACSYEFNPSVEFSITVSPEPKKPVSFTGDYAGPFESTDNVGNPLAKSTGTLRLHLVSEGDMVSGYYTFSNINVTQFHSFNQIQLGGTAPDSDIVSVSGTINGDSVEFTDGWITFSGNLYSGNKLVLNFESCYLNGCCVNPEHVGESYEGTPSGVEGVPDVPAPEYDCSVGVIGSAELMR